MRLPEVVISDPSFIAARKVYNKLKVAGFESYFAGGCVRDILLQRQPHDYDIATKAQPDQVQALFQKTVNVGAQFGVIVVVESGYSIEVATFRQDGGYQDGRRPSRVDYSEAREDAERRDFTMNSLFLSVEPLRLIDFTQGQTDIEQRLIRAVGDPQLRFAEDHLRIFRAIRFAAQLDFTIHEKTWQAILSNKLSLSQVSRERIRDELIKMMKGAGFIKVVLSYAKEADLLSLIFPTLKFDYTLFKDWDLSLEDSWAQLFSVALNSGSNWHQVSQAVESLMLSRQQRKEIEDFLYWRVHPESQQTWRLGRLIEKLLNPAAWRGWQFFWQRRAQQLTLAEQQLLQKIQLLRPPTRPVPWFCASDFMPRLSGERLGLWLKWAFWLQLEKGQVGSAHELQLLKQQIVDQLVSGQGLE